MATYGIDLGTTYSCVAYIDDVGRPAIAKNADGHDTTPSVVFFETPESIVVGGVAKQSALTNPDQVVSLIKRQMGETVELEYHGVKHSPESISALILKELARAAELYTHQPVRDVVITVPAYFGVREREATRNAGKIAGLNVLNVVPEPVAAALHYEVVSSGPARTILVYDLGGGTFDTTVIRLENSDIDVVCTDGDHRLGGADWDTKVSQYLLDQFATEHPGSDALGDEDFLQELAKAAEEVKQTLSTAERARHIMRFAKDTTKAELTRASFEQITAELLERTFRITERTIEVAREKGYEKFDDVLLVGGSSRMPAVAAGLRERFGFDPKLHDPDLAVAKGAALFALIESVKVSLPDGADAGQDGVPLDEQSVEEVADRLGLAPDQVRKLAEKRVTTVVPRAFGVKVYSKAHPDADAEGSVVDHLLKANTALPAAPPTQQYYTMYDRQTSIQIEIWEQAGSVESARPKDNQEIGNGVISDLPPLPVNSPINVDFAMNETGTLRVHAVELTTGRELHIELEIDGLTSAEVEEARQSVAQYTVSQ